MLSSASKKNHPKSYSSSSDDTEQFQPLGTKYSSIKDSDENRDFDVGTYIDKEVSGWWVSNIQSTSVVAGPVHNNLPIEEVSKSWSIESRKALKVVEIELVIPKSAEQAKASILQIVQKNRPEASLEQSSLELQKLQNPLHQEVAQKTNIEVSDYWDVETLSIVNIESLDTDFSIPETIRTHTPDLPETPLLPVKKSNTQQLPKTTAYTSVDEITQDKHKQLPHKIILNGKVEAALHAYESETEYLLFELEAIAELLFDSVSLDKANNKVKYHRSRDGANFVMDMVTGEVIANGHSVGFLKEVSLINLELGLFPANAVQVFSGLLLNRDNERLVVDMKLDKRLQYITGFDLHINGKKLPFVTPEPRSLGHVLLLPIEVIVEELGSKLSVSGNTITVTRIQDGARISLNLATGLVRTNEHPVGNAPNIAYADRAQLLLPREAVAALTGTYITILPGSRRIDVDLDGDLSRIIHPGDSIRSRTANSPATVESARVFYDSENRMNTIVKGHYSEYNIHFEYETPSTQGDDGFTPDWLQLSAESIDGWAVSVGDLSANNRELNGVNVSRLSGVSYYKPVKNGLLVAVAGKPQSGVKLLDNDHQIAIFDGLATGVRYFSQDEDFEIGIAARDDDDSDYRALVVSTYKSIENPDFLLGQLSQRADVALGIYNIEDDNSAGGQISWEVRLEPTNKITAFARGDYRSSEVITGFDKKTQITYDNKIADSFSWGAGASYRPFQRLSFALNHNETRRGVVEGEVIDDIYKWQETSGASISFNPFDNVWSPWTYLSWEKSETSESEDVKRLSGQAVWKVDAYNLLLGHIDRKSRKRGNSWLTQVELSRDPWIKFFKKDSSVRLSPRISAWKGDESSSAALGALLAYDSGRQLGNRTKLTLAYGKNLGIQQIEVEDEEDTSNTTGADYFSANLAYKLNRLLRFNTNYYNTLDGEDDVYASLSAFYEFNPPRRIKKTRDNAGILMGQVFLDENYDGIQQDKEQGVGGARVAIVGTRVALNSDPNGHFTIQNLPVGVYRITPDISRMPLGYVGRQGLSLAVKIDDARITELKIPIVKGHQLSGVVYVDTNNDGTLSRGDERVEGIGLELSRGQESASTAFGQFTFDFLPPGDYKVIVQEDTLPEGYEVDSSANLQALLKSNVRKKLLVKLRKK